MEENHEMLDAVPETAAVCINLHQVWLPALNQTNQNSSVDGGGAPKPHIIR